MSIFSGLIKEMKSFAAWAEKELAKVFKDAPTISQVADTVIDYVGPILETIITAEAGAPAAAVVAAVIREVQSDLVVVGGLIYDIGTAPTVATKIQAMENDMNGLLTAGHITNQKTVSLVTLVIREFGALLSAFQPATPAA